MLVGGGIARNRGPGLVETWEKLDQDSSWLFLGSVRQTQGGNHSQFDSELLLHDFPWGFGSFTGTSHHLSYGFYNAMLYLKCLFFFFKLSLTKNS